MPGRPIRVTVTRTLAAPAREVYDILADYRRGHPSVLPARAFTHLTVEEGGRGEGTVIRFGMKAFGKVNEARAVVSEPEPGRVLVETARDGSDVVTTFRVAPVAGGQASVTIDTTWTPRGSGALLERLAAPFYLRGVYKEQLGNLEKVATGAL